MPAWREQKLAGQPFYMGYNAMDDKIQNLLEAGIIDPAKVKSHAGYLLPGGMPPLLNTSTLEFTLPHDNPKTRMLCPGMTFACCSSGSEQAH